VAVGRLAQAGELLGTLADGSGA